MLKNLSSSQHTSTAAVPPWLRGGLKVCGHLLAWGAGTVVAVLVQAVISGFQQGH